MSKISQKFFYSAIFLIPLFFASCDYGAQDVFYRENPVSERANKLKLVEPPDLSSKDHPEANRTEYDVLIITDVHFGGEHGKKTDGRRDKEFFDWIETHYTEKSYPAFCICLGDVAEHGYKSEFRDYLKFTDELFERFGIKTYNVIGNHDLYNDGWEHYKDLLFPYTSFYKFRTERFTWYGLDSASGTLGDRQLTVFSRDAEYNENGRPKIVFMHVPAYAGNFFYFIMQNTEERNTFLSYCAKSDVRSLICGHTHLECTSDLGFTEYVLPGYLERRGWGILSVNENAGTATCKSYYLE